jgi:hypothetical protein
LFSAGYGNAPRACRNGKRALSHTLLSPTLAKMHCREWKIWLLRRFESINSPSLLLTYVPIRSTLCRVNSKKPRRYIQSLHLNPSFFYRLPPLARREKSQLLWNQANPASFSKMPGWGGHPECFYWIPGGGGIHISFFWHQQRSPRLFRDTSAVFTSHQSRSFPLCFHILTNCLSRKPFIFTTIRIARGWGPHSRKRIHGKTRNLPGRRSPFNAVFRHSMHGNTV